MTFPDLSRFCSRSLSGNVLVPGRFQINLSGPLMNLERSERSERSGHQGKFPWNVPDGRPIQARLLRRSRAVPGRDRPALGKAEA